MTPPPAAAARTAPAVHPRRAPLAPVRRPRRVSGPAPARRTASPARTAPAAASHPLLDRLIHGRAWIAIIAFALIGIVTMQLGLLKLNAGIGRALEHEAALQRENSALSVENSEVAAGDTVELQAAHMGMQLIPAGALRFLAASGSGGDLARAVAAAQAPASGATPTSASTEASTSAEAVPPTTSTEATTTTPTTTTTPSAAGQTAESTSTSAGSATAASTSAASAGAPATGAASTGAPAPAPAPASTPTPTPTTAPTGESGGASASPGG
jgi:hypothetical protein